MGLNLNLIYRSLLCDVVRQKVEMEIASKTSSAASGEEVILVRNK